VGHVEPSLVTVDRVLAVEASASIDISPDSARLVDGMNAEVEIISRESRDTLLVPLQALRELGSDEYAVFVVQPDGEMLLRPVEVGMTDPVNAEILSGLEVGETVSTGVQESTEPAVPEEMMPFEEPQMPPGDQGFPGGGPGMGSPGG
jgi:multidrug efflux pump subunit AcrA (membrane-fusion protein)